MGNMSKENDEPATPAEELAAAIVDMGAKINDAGEVSALCFKTPHAIDLKRSRWTNRKEAVTCPKCKRLLTEVQ
jgi:hypothetical protein